MPLPNTSRTIFTLLIIGFLLHNMEESIALRILGTASPLKQIKTMNFDQFLVAVTAISTISLLAYFIAIRAKNMQLYLFLSTSIASVLLFNVFMPHFFLAAYMQSYTPGLTSALMLTMPLSLLTLHKNKQNYIQLRRFYFHIILGLLAGYLIFAVITQLALKYS